jgi:hypothetical protein
MRGEDGDMLPEMGKTNALGVAGEKEGIEDVEGDGEGNERP